MRKEDKPIRKESTAEETYNQYAQFYDMMTAHHVEDLSIYKELTESIPPPYLEVGSGTGRVISFLLSRKPQDGNDHYITGVDVSTEMIARSEQKTHPFIGKGVLHLANHDFSHSVFQERKFNAAFVTFFTLNYITEDLQLNFLANIGHSLHSGAIITIDCFFPYLKWHPEAARQWRQVSTSDPNVGLQEKTEMITSSVEKREWVFTNQDSVVSNITTHRMYVSPDKGKNLLQSAGFTEIHRLIDYKLPGSDDFTEGSHGYNFVLIAKKP